MRGKDGDEMAVTARVRRASAMPLRPDVTLMLLRAMMPIECAALQSRDMMPARDTAARCRYAY